MNAATTEILPLENQLHAEMQLVKRLLVGVTNDRIHRGMFNRYYIGVSKEVCQKCATILDFLEIGHRETHDRPTEQDGWDYPHTFFENEYPNLNSGRFAGGDDPDDGDYIP